MAISVHHPIFNYYQSVTIYLLNTEALKNIEALHYLGIYVVFFKLPKFLILSQAPSTCDF